MNNPSLYPKPDHRCERCHASLTELLCVRCSAAPETKRRVYMSFFVRGGGEWVVNFTEGDLRTPIGRIRSYRDAQVIRDLAERGGALKVLAHRQSMEAAIDHGRGGLYLELTQEQYARLKR